MDNNLIFDIGMNHGEDTEYYLCKGFHVIAVECNPNLVDEVSARLAPYIRSKQLVICPVGIAKDAGYMEFYINLDNDHLSSFVKELATKDGSLSNVLNVQCITLREVLEDFAKGRVPRYMKIDIDGACDSVLNELALWKEKPKFVSVEEYGLQTIHDLKMLGYDRFSIYRQRLKFDSPPKPPREGEYCGRSFSGKDSGLFGLELPGPWLNARDSAMIFETFVRRPDGHYVGPEHEWYDIHATKVEFLEV